jgi:CheY-like chemotaxis protein
MAKLNPILQFPQRFLRTALEFNSMVRLTCKACSRPIAYSSNPTTLDIAEKAHQCWRRRNATRVFMVDGDLAAAHATAEVLRRSGFEVLTFSDALLAAQSALESAPKIVVTDFAIPNINGLVLTAWLNMNYPACKVVVMSGDAATITEQAPVGLTFTFVTKPVVPETLAAMIESLCHGREDPPLLAKAR